MQYFSYSLCALGGLEYPQQRRRSIHSPSTQELCKYKLTLPTTYVMVSPLSTPLLSPILGILRYPIQAHIFQNTSNANLESKQ